MKDDLAKLPANHPLRNMPLVEIGAHYKNRSAKAASWKEVLPTYAIAGKCFNDLGPCWTDNDQWKATIDE